MQLKFYMKNFSKLLFPCFNLTHWVCFLLLINILMLGCGFSRPNHPDTKNETQTKSESAKDKGPHNGANSDDISIPTLPAPQVPSLGAGPIQQNEQKGAVNTPTQPLLTHQSFQILPQDWKVESSRVGKIQIESRYIQEEKLQILLNYFEVPRLLPISVPESSGFELYDISGVSALEKNLYIAPKIYLNTGLGKNQVLGYRIADSQGMEQPMIDISFPVALVDGLVGYIPNHFSSSTAADAAVALPKNMKIQDRETLEKKLNLPVQTLPVCPRRFRLAFGAYEFWSDGPFDGLSVCPINQFFRVHFKIPADQAQTILDAAAVRENSLFLEVNLQTSFSWTIRNTKLKIPGAELQMNILKYLEMAQVVSHSPQGVKGYSQADIEESLLAALFQVAKSVNLRPRYGNGIASFLYHATNLFFETAFDCGDGGICRSPKIQVINGEEITYFWNDEAEYAAPIELMSSTSIGSVANKSQFESLPAPEIWEKYLQQRSFGQGVETGNHVIPPLEKQDAGFTPFGTNTTVYPGAWLKIELDEISEFTTAKTRKGEQGRYHLESEVIDLLKDQPLEKRVRCLEGGTVACNEFQLKKVPILDTKGDPLLHLSHCLKGSANCQCQKEEEGQDNSQNKCMISTPVLTSEMDFECAPEDQFEFCPYVRQEEQVIDYELTYSCENVLVEESSKLGGYLSKDKRYERQCKEQSRIPKTAMRQVLDCYPDNHQGRHARVKKCLAPKYLCKSWNRSCARYQVDEVYHVVHQDLIPKWRPFAIDQGEYPKRFEEDLLLKFVSPNYSVTQCRLDRFPREFRGKSIYIKIPADPRETEKICGQAIWSDHNMRSDQLPKLYLKNMISYSQFRLCGKTEYSYLTREVPLTGGQDLVPSLFRNLTEIRVGPVSGTCLVPGAIKSGSDLIYTETPPVKFSGTISVLGKVLESIMVELPR